MDALPNEILGEIGDYLMPDPLTIHMLLCKDRLDFEVCGESMESGPPEAVLLAKKRYVKDLHLFGKTCRAAQNIRDFIFHQRLTVCFFSMQTVTRVLDTQNLQPFRSVEVVFKCANESILPSLRQLSKFTQLACLKIRLLMLYAMTSSRFQEFKQQVKQPFSPSVKLDIGRSVFPKDPLARQRFEPAHWCNKKCKEYYSPDKAQPRMLIRIIPSYDYPAAGVVLSVEDFAAGVVPSVEDLTPPPPSLANYQGYSGHGRRPRRRSRVGP